MLFQIFFLNFSFWKSNHGQLNESENLNLAFKLTGFFEDEIRHLDFHIQLTWYYWVCHQEICLSRNSPHLNLVIHGLHVSDRISHFCAAVQFSTPTSLGNVGWTQITIFCVSLIIMRGLSSSIRNFISMFTTQLSYLIRVLFIKETDKHRKKHYNIKEINEIYCKAIFFAGV